MKQKRFVDKPARDEAHFVDASAVRVSKANSIFPILIIVVFSFGVYFNAFSGGFVYDDTYQILNNPWIRDIGNVPLILSKSVWSFRPGLSTSNYYRPLMHITYMADYHLFGLKPWGFHLVNILFHCGVSVLVFLVFQRLLAEHKLTTSSAYLSPPFVAALLFVSHPVHTEAVTWIAGLTDVAFAFFYLLSFYSFISFRNGSKRGYLWSVFLFAVAVFFKEPALTLPIVLIAYDYLLKKSDETVLSSIKKYIPYIVVSGVYLLVRYYALRSFAAVEFYAGLSTYQSIINVFPLFSEYLASLLWPFNLNFWHTFHPISSLSEARGMISIVVSVIFFLVAVAAYRKDKVIFFGLLLFVIPLLPVFYIKGIAGKPFAERYLYLPSVGYVLLPAVFQSWAREKLPRAAKSITIVLIIIAGLYAAATITRNYVWKDNFILWSDTVGKSPDSADAHDSLGTEYASRGALDTAIAEYQIALRLKPDFAEAHYNLGAAYSSTGLTDMAIAEYQIALRLNPYLAEAHANLGVAYASKGLLDMAMAEYQIALQLNPSFAEAHYNLGAAYSSTGLTDMAIAEYQSALRLKPDFAEAHYNLGGAYASKGLLDMAITEYQAVLRLTPDNAMDRYQLALTYLKQGNTDMARKEVEQILTMRPDLYEVRQLLNDIISGRQ